MERFELRIVGTGGNGILLAGLILANASIEHDELHVALTQAYSPESRGGYSKSELKLSKKEILFPKVTTPNLLAILSDTVIGQDTEGLTNEALVITDDGVDIEVLSKTLTCGTILQYPFLSFSQSNFHSVLYTNMLIIGVISHHLPWLSSESILDSMKEKVKNKSLETNIRAYLAGTSLQPSRILRK